MESMQNFLPFTIQYSIDPVTFEPKDEIIKRTLSSMKGAFLDQAAAEQILAKEDPLIVEVFMAPVPAGPGFLMANINVVYPGKVGNEFYMTKGHIHDDPIHAPEIYITLRGTGKLVLQTLEGKFHMADMQPGAINYIPAPWAHRCVNCGDEPLVYLGIFPANTRRDYSFDSSNFKKRIVAQDGQVVAVDNTRAK
jgi:glucose-6-phosphate isomerase